MTCAIVKGLLDLFLEGRLAPLQAGWVEAHLAACGRCEEESARLGTLRHELRALPPRCAPEALKASLRAALSRTETSESAPAPDWQLPPLALTVGAAAFVASIAVSVAGPGPQSQACAELGHEVCAAEPGREAP